jgi:hypothetical protein
MPDSSFSGHWLPHESCHLYWCARKHWLAYDSSQTRGGPHENCPFCPFNAMHHHHERLYATEATTRDATPSSSLRTVIFVVTPDFVE